MRRHGKPQVIVDGQWLSGLMSWGDLEWATCWPGGTESITFATARHHRIFRPGAIVELDYGGLRLAVASMVEPTRGEPLMAEGLHRLAEEYVAVGPLPDRELATSVHQAVDEAIVRGLPWAPRINDLSPESGIRGMPRLDPDQPHSVAQFLDQSATERNEQWGVNADRRVFMGTWQAADLHMLPGLDGLAISRDGYASVLIGRYLDSSTGTFKTVSVKDEAAEARWGRVERTVTEVLGEGTAMTLGDAQQILVGVLSAGRAQMGWAAPLEVQHGDIVTANGRAVDLNRLHARRTVRLHGLDLDVCDLSGRNWDDMRPARIRHKDGAATIEPVGLSQPMNDALAGLSA
jgi:hypothetical protein